MRVLEYINDVRQALAEMHCVLKPGGRFVNFATNWGALFWNSPEPARMERMVPGTSTPPIPTCLRLPALMVDVGFPEFTKRQVRC
jgi:hypothetical protein